MINNFFDEDLTKDLPETIEVRPEDILDKSDLIPNGDFDVRKVSDSDISIEEKLRDAIKSLSEKYGLDPKSLSLDKVLDNTDLINTDDDTFDLVASKLITDYLRRVNLRGILTQAKLVEKIWDVMEKSIDMIEAFDADAISMVNKGFEYQEKLTAIMDRFKKSGVEESLKHAANERAKKENKEDVVWTNADIQTLINKLRESDGK